MTGTYAAVAGAAFAGLVGDPEALVITFTALNLIAGGLGIAAGRPRPRQPRGRNPQAAAGPA